MSIFATVSMSIVLSTVICLIAVHLFLALVVHELIIIRIPEATSSLHSLFLTLAPFLLVLGIGSFILIWVIILC